MALKIQYFNGNISYTIKLCTYLMKYLRPSSLYSSSQPCGRTVGNIIITLHYIVHVLLLTINTKYLSHSYQCLFSFLYQTTPRFSSMLRQVQWRTWVASNWITLYNRPSFSLWMESEENMK